MIILLALPNDREKADAIVDAMVAEDLAIWGETTEPGGSGWSDAMAKVQEARCLVVCWSEAALGETKEAKLFREIAIDECGKGRTIGVTLDATSPPSEFACSTYDLSDWRLAPKGLRKLLIGDTFLRDVIVAAKYKQANRDPAPPSAPTKLLVRQIAVFSSAFLVPLIAVIGFAETLFNFSDRLTRQPSAAEQSAWEALPSGDCKALRGFVQNFGDGAYRERADAILAAAETRKKTVWEPQSFDEEIYLPHSAGTQEANAQNEGGIRCKMLVQGTGARKLEVSVSKVRQDCQSVGSERVCDWRGTATCTFEAPQDAEIKICSP